LRVRGPVGDPTSPDCNLEGEPGLGRPVYSVDGRHCLPFATDGTAQGLEQGRLEASGDDNPVRGKVTNTFLLVIRVDGDRTGRVAGVEHPEDLIPPLSRQVVQVVEDRVEPAVRRGVPRRQGVDRRAARFGHMPGRVAVDLVGRKVSDEHGITPQEVLGDRHNKNLLTVYIKPRSAEASPGGGAGLLTKARRAIGIKRRRDVFVNGHSKDVEGTCF
jgi:hypothetical protein